MSDEPTVTEREARMRERAAFAAGAEYAYGGRGPNGSIVWENHARRRYPITKRVPRYATLANGTRVRFGASCNLEAYVLDGGHEYGTGLRVEEMTAADFRAIADLLANPYEEIEE